MNASAAALFLAPMIGVRTLDINWDGNNANQPGLVPGDLEAMALAETQALQEIFGSGPSSISEQRFTDTVLRAPKSVSFNATQFSTTISSFVGWESWMAHCTVQGGDGEDNELLSATELARPYMAGSAPVVATVYHDAVVLPEWVKNTIDPVSCGLNPHLDCAANRDEFRAWTTSYQGSQRPRPEVAYNIATFTKSTGTPSIYLVEPRYVPGAGPLELVMRFNPMPAQVTALAFRVRRKPPVITVDDITGASLYPNILLVTGGDAGITPNAIGMYGRVFGQLGGDDYNLPSYGRIKPSHNTSIDWQIRLNYAVGGTGLWTIEPTSGDLSAGYFAHLTAGPLGTYFTASPGTGTATVTSIGSYGSAGQLPIPTDWNESIFIPFARKYFMAHPSFDNRPLAGAIMDQYNTAKRLLESFKPRIAPTPADYR